MRMDLSKNETALAFLERISKDELITILQENSDEVMAVQIATCLKMIPIPTTTVELSERIRKTVKDYATKEGAEKPTKEDLDSTVARTMQAIRIEVNGEFLVLDKLLEALPCVLNEGGRVVFLTFHSGEDRRVKKALKAGFKNGVYSEWSRDVVRYL
jgi:16S rRNA (cytosine1402-N4)-methyltransferase